MCKFSVVLIAAIGWLLQTAPSGAQDANLLPAVPATKLEALATNTGTVIIQGTAQIGGLSAKAGVVSVSCKEVTDTGTGRKEYGIAVGVTVGGQQQDTTIIDYDEMDSLLKAIDYLSRVDGTVTPWPSFDATYTTRGGLRLAAFSSQRTGTIGFALRSGRLSKKTVVQLSRDQLVQFQGLIGQAKSKLDSIRIVK